MKAPIPEEYQGLPVVTPRRMAELDRAATAEFGLPVLQLMENAGRAVAQETARFLVGSERIRADGSPNCAIVDAGHQRDLDLAIEVPPTDLEAVCSNDQWKDIYDRLAELIGDACTIRTVSADGRWLVLAALHHHDPERADALRRLLDATPQRTDEGVSARVAQDGEPLLMPVVDQERLAAGRQQGGDPRDGEARRLGGQGR